MVIEPKNATILILLTVSFQLAGETPTLTNEWSFLLPYPSDSSPAIGTDGTIYIGVWNGDMRAFLPDGKPKWVFHTGREIASSPAIGSDGTIYFGCRDRNLHALGSDGKRKWEFKTDGWIDSSPALGIGGTIYFGSWDGKFYALNPNGTKKWEFNTGATIVSSPAIGPSERICFGSHDKNFYCLTSEGTKEWAFVTGGPITSSPAADNDGTMYFSSVDGFLYALDPQGKLKWRLKTGGVSESSPVIGQNGTVFIGVNHSLWAISSDGKKIWDQPYGPEPVVAAPLALADNSVCCSSRQGILVDRITPDQFSWVCDRGYTGGSSPTIDERGTIYISGQLQGTGTYLYAMHSSGSLSRSAWPKFRGTLGNTGRASSNVQVPPH